MSSNHNNKQTTIILILVTALVSLFWLYVGEQAEDFSSDTLTAAGDQKVYHWKLVTS